MPDIKCFMIELTERSRRWLRRYSSGDGKCRDGGYHNIHTRIEDGAADEPSVSGPTAWPLDDPRWPAVCSCGYRFTDKDERQLFTLHVWRRTDDGEEFVLHPNMEGTAPPGAMFRADWLEPRYVGSDGISLGLVTPGGTWLIDFPASSGGGRWTRTGTPPMITAMPSILTPSYHGWLRDGVLVDA